jgi:hypothetical protein
MSLSGLQGVERAGARDPGGDHGDSESAWVSRSTKAFGALPSRSLKVDGEICAKERLDLELSAFEARSSYLMGRRDGVSLVKAATNSL